MLHHRNPNPYYDHRDAQERREKAREVLMIALIAVIMFAAMLVTP